MQNPQHPRGVRTAGVAASIKPAAAPLPATVLLEVVQPQKVLQARERALIEAAAVVGVVRVQVAVAVASVAEAVRVGVAADGAVAAVVIAQVVEDGGKYLQTL
jgi:hypothetical protein